MIVLIGCPANCRGEDYPCILEIVKVTGDNKVAFMLYAQHVMDKLISLNKLMTDDTKHFKVEIKYQNGIPIGMYISLKPQPSIYEIFQ